MADVVIESLTADGSQAVLKQLRAILEDAVDDGASVGFLPPLTPQENAAYWDGVVRAVAAGSRVLLVARTPDGDVVGTAQLDLAQQPNARHRAEVMKVMVHRSARRQGIGHALMAALDTDARRLGRTTLVLDTRLGDPSERLYSARGWTRAGVIPGYARSADGSLDPSAFYYRILDGGGPG